MPHLTDTRRTNAADPDAIMRAIAEDELAIIRQSALADQRVARIHADLQDRTAAVTARLAANQRRLTAWIMANQGQFRKPRAKVVPQGRYGLRTVTNVKLEDPEEVVAFADTNGYTDLVSREPVVSKTALRKRLEAGEDIPGATIDRGEVAFYKLDPSLVDQAKQGA